MQISSHHITTANATTTLSIIGVSIIIYGLVVLEIWPALFGAGVDIIGETRFVDRIVWLYEDMKHMPEYAKWQYKI
jgi:hypothetical protein